MEEEVFNKDLGEIIRIGIFLPVPFRFMRRHYTEDALQIINSKSETNSKFKQKKAHELHEFSRISVGANH